MEIPSVKNFPQGTPIRIEIMDLKNWNEEILFTSDISLDAYTFDATTSVAYDISKTSVSFVNADWIQPAPFK